MRQLTKEEFDTLRGIDTPTICNAIERFKLRDDTTGFVGTDLRCMFPEFGPTLGIALTVEVDTTTPQVKRDAEVWKEWTRAMQAAPKPIFLVFKDISADPKHSAHIGEVMATLSKRLGVVGLLTDGGVRDLNEVRALGMQMFALGAVSSHGNPRLISVGKPVDIDGVIIKTGDLLHGDLNGVTTIPWECAQDIAAMADVIRAEEAEVMRYIKSDEFEVEEFLRRKFSH